MALFTDFGTVAPRVADLDFGEHEARLWHRVPLQHAESVLFRFDIATGAGEGIHYYFKFSNVF